MADTVAAVLQCPLAVARRLLQQAGGDADSAVALGLAGHAQEEPSTPRSQLRAVIGGEVTRQQAARLLARAGGSVQAAAELYLDEGAGAAGPPGAQDDVISISDTSSGSG